jgi:hypothetical protein
MDELMLGAIKVRALAAVKAPARYDTLALLSDLHVPALVDEVRRLQEVERRALEWLDADETDAFPDVEADFVEFLLGLKATTQDSSQ